MAQYEIVLKNQTRQPKKSPISGDTKEVKVGNKSQIGSETGRSSTLEKVISYGVVKSFAQQILQHRVNTVELRTGSAELQQKISFAYQIGNQALSIIESVAVGAMVGGLPGAIVGAVASVSHTLIGYVQNAQKIRWQGELENISNTLINVRAGGQIQSYGESRERRQ